MVNERRDEENILTRERDKIGQKCVIRSLMIYKSLPQNIISCRQTRFWEISSEISAEFCLIVGTLQWCHLGVQHSIVSLPKRSSQNDILRYPFCVTEYIFQSLTIRTHPHCWADAICHLFRTLRTSDYNFTGVCFVWHSSINRVRP